jgi:hypothetical protein
MDTSQYIRLKMEAANVYKSKSKTVDSSLLTLQRQQKAAYSGTSSVIIPVPYDSGSCPSNHLFTEGYVSPGIQTNDSYVARLAGGYVCNTVNYSTDTPGVTLLNCTEVSTILTSYNNLTSKPSTQCKIDPNAHFFPGQDNCTTNCENNTPLYPS